jgi:tight adherence protein B
LISVVASASAAYGVYLLYSACNVDTRDVGARRGRLRSRIVVWRGGTRSWLTQAGLDGIPPRDLVLAVVMVSGVAALIASTMFGGLLPVIVSGVLAAGMPVELARQRRRTRRLAAQEAWPKLIEEIRLLTGSVGRSIPQALFEAGRAAPIELRPAFDAAHREWLLSTDFTRTINVLEAQLGDAAADTTCETLLIAYETGGTNLDRRLADLAADRRTDLRYRKDARARQAGVRFARRFVLIVPLGMAFAGMSVGDGRAAYSSAAGQLAAVVALVMIAACWIWAGRLMQLPDEERVFNER